MDAPPQLSATESLDRPSVHALSNHLAVILGFIDLVLQDTEPDDPRREDLGEIKRAAVEAARIIGRPIDDPADSSQAP